MDVTIETLDAPGARVVLDELEALLEDAVVGGASVGFVLPLAPGEVASYWRGALAAMGGGTRRLLVARADARVAGAVQLALEPRANGLHRAEVQKLLVARWARRQGIGESLMRAAEAEARTLGRFLLVLDTREGDDAQRLYTHLGYALAGVIPHYALSPEQTSYDGSAFMYKDLRAG